MSKLPGDGVKTSNFKNPALMSRIFFCFFIAPLKELCYNGKKSWRNHNNV